MKGHWSCSIAVLLKILILDFSSEKLRLLGKLPTHNEAMNKNK